MDAEHELVLRLGVSYAEEVILDESAHFRALYPDAWKSLSLPK